MRKNVACWLLVLSVIVNGWLPLFATHTPPVGNPVRFSSVFGNRILICTGDGFTWVKLADLQSGKEKPAPPSGKCPLCYAASHWLNAVTPAPAPALDNYVSPQVAVHYYSFLLPLYRASPLQVRAPPLSFIG